MSTTVAEAVLDRLGQLVDPAYDGHVPRDTRGQPRESRYAVLWADVGVRRSDDMASSRLEVVTRFQVSSVGSSAQQARWVAVQCRDGLLGWTPSVTGMVLAPPEHETSGPARRDDDLPSPLFLAVDTYVVHGVRTSP